MSDPIQRLRTELPSNPRIAAHVLGLRQTDSTPEDQRYPNGRHARVYTAQSTSSITPTFPNRSAPMSTPTVRFTGKANQLEALKLDCKLKFKIDPTFAEDKGAQAAYFAGAFHGDARTWLAQHLEDTPDALDDYTTLVEAVEEEFALTPREKTAEAQRRIEHLTQKGPAQQYALRFDHLASQLNLSEDTKVYYFKKGLKQNVRAALIATTSDSNSYGTLREEAIRVDHELYTTWRPTGNRRQGDKGKAKCFKCGKFGHKADKCNTIKSEN